jgi:dTMP kinase
MAYQGTRGMDPAEIRRRNEEFAPVPDLVLWLDLPVELALRRIGARGEGDNAFEKRESLESCRRIFASLEGEPFMRRIDAAQSADDVFRDVSTAVAGMIPELAHFE